MKKPILAILALILASLACGQYVTPTPVPNSPVDTGTPSPTVLPVSTPTITSPSPTPTPDTVHFATVILPVVYVRDVPDGAVIATVTSGSSVEIVTCEESWCQIKEPAGWIWRGCLSDNPDGLGCSSR